LPCYLFYGLSFTQDLSSAFIAQKNVTLLTEKRTHLYSLVKKFAVISLLFLYLLPAIGFSVTEHYCCGKRASVSWWGDGGEKCPCGKQKRKKACCQDKVCTFKLHDSQEQAPQITLAGSKTPLLVAETYVTSSICKATQPAIARTKCCHPPPLAADEPLYVLHQVFRI